MKRFLMLYLLAVITSCASNSEQIAWEEPNYNYIASHVRVISKSPTHVVYEYKDIRVDEIAPVAALYCQDRGGKQASLYEITMRPDHYRRATFVCQEITQF